VGSDFMGHDYDEVLQG